MKYYAGQLGYFLNERSGRRNLRVLTRFVVILLLLILVYTVLFHYIMMLEGQKHSWLTGFYWTLTVMSTLGFGDITFHSDLGRVFSILVLLTGIVMLLILLPFTIIQFFYAPWIQAQAAARTPTFYEGRDGHVVLTHHDPSTEALIRKLDQYGHEYALLVPDTEEAAHLHDQGLNVVVGDFDDPETYERVRASKAALVATTHNDYVNTHAASAVRAVAPDVPIVATAQSEASVDILELAGAGHVFQPAEQLGHALTRGIVGGDAITHPVGRVGELVIAEANTARTPMTGKTLREARLREIGVTVLGIWNRGVFEPATGETVISENAILLLAGSEEQMQAYDEAFVIYNVSVEPVLIIGGGRVGKSAARLLTERDVDWRVVEKDPSVTTDPERTIIGDAADLEVLKRAGIDRAPAVLITTHNDDLNIYLTIYCRKLRPDIQIISRTSVDRNVASLHRAGADFVLSYASMAASAMFNLVRDSGIVPIAEGLEVFRVPTPTSLVGKTLAESGVRQRTECSVIGVGVGERITPNPPPDTTLEAGNELVLVGSSESGRRFHEVFVDGQGER